MHKIRAYNADAARNLVEYQVRSRRSRHETEELVTATRKVIDLSFELAATIETLLAEFTSDLTRKGWLWPAYQSAPHEPEMEAAPLLAAPVASLGFSF
jgi:hypothetical protein